MNKELEANTALTHYRIDSKISAGGMGEVFLAEDMQLRRPFPVASVAKPSRRRIVTSGLARNKSARATPG